MTIPSEMELQQLELLLDRLETGEITTNITSRQTVKLWFHSDKMRLIGTARALIEQCRDSK